MPKGIKGFQKGNHARKKAPHTLLASKMKERYVQNVYKISDELFEAEKALALGHKVLKGEEVYDVPPDGNTIKNMRDRGQGKATDSIEINNPNELEAIKESNKLIKELIDSTKHD